MKSDASLPLDGQRILELAARSMFDLFANASDRHAAGGPQRAGRVDQRPVPALSARAGLRGRRTSWATRSPRWCRTRRCTQVLETGKPILIDLLTNKAGTFGVSRIPLRDERAR